LELGQYENALPIITRALEIIQKIHGTEHPDTANSMSSLAYAYGKLGQYEKALKLEIRALAILEKVLGSDHPSTANAMHNLAFTFGDLNNYPLKIYLLKSSVNSYQAVRNNVSKIGPEELKSFTKTVESSYYSLIRLLVDDDRLAEAQKVLEMLKEDEFFEFIRRNTKADPNRTKIGFTAEESRWSSFYKEVADRMIVLEFEQRQLQQKAKSGLTAGEKARLAELKADLNVAEQAFTKFLSEMRSNLTAQGPAKVDEVAATSLASQRELQSIIRDLGPDVVLLQYYVTSSKVGVILTTPNVVIPFSTEIDAKVLNRQVFNLKNALRDPKLSVLGPSQSLYQLLLAPVAQALEQTGAKTVMLSLDGQLRHIPFGALHDGTQFAAQRWNFPIYTSVTRDRLRGGSTAKWKAAGLGVTKSIGSFSALPAVKAEMDGLLRAAGGQSGQSVVYLDEKFTAQRLKDVGQRDFQLMHISSHFSISPGTEVNSFLLLGDGQRLTLGDMRTQNYRFDNVDLLTLSACDTGVGGGRDNTGKEIEGLGVIAQQQGAKAVLATLWPVADGSTAKLMSDMYQRRQSQGLSKIEALRQAQLAMMSQPKYAHPFYWAPFILLGHWQ
jgi:CHAT domain-containing protein